MTVQSPPVVEKRRVSYQEYRALPEDGKRYEVIGGELIVTAAPVLNHQRVLRNLMYLLESYNRANGWGEILMAPVEVYLDQENFVEPDLVAVSEARSGILAEKNIHGAPDLVVEILSPSTARTDRIRKAKLYAQHQVTHYWIIDYSDQTLEAFKWDNGAYRLIAALAEDEHFEALLFPGLEIPLAELWK